MRASRWLCATALLVGCAPTSDAPNETELLVAGRSTPPAASPSPIPAAIATAPADPTSYPAFSKAHAAGPPGPKQYKLTRGRTLDLPLGDASFADEPAADDIRFRDAGLALGPPDYVGDGDDDRNGPKDMTLGCGGSLTVRFTDNVLIDVPGPDLYVFEIGPMVEPMNVAISPDGSAWQDVGRIEGGTASLDIGAVAQRAMTYRYVRLTDARKECAGRFPGADIDAVAAIGAALSISLDSSVLFDVDRSELKPAASSELIRAATILTGWSGKAVSIEGHTDATGQPAHNQALSEARAQAVRDFLAGRPELKGKVLQATGLAATRPVATNQTAEGRAANRRVDVILAPDGPGAARP